MAMMGMIQPQVRLVAMRMTTRNTAPENTLSNG